MEGSVDVEQNTNQIYDNDSYEIRNQNEHEENNETPTIDVFINGASNLKTLLYIWKAMSTSFVFNFMKNRIFSTASNRTNTILLNLTIPENKLLKYHFDYKQIVGDQELSEEDINEMCIIGCVPTVELESRLRSCGKGASFTISMWKNDSNLYFKQKGVDTGTSFIRMTITTCTEYNLPEMPPQTIVRIMTNDFVAALKSVIPDKVDKFVFIPFVDGLHIITVGSSGQMICYNPFGECTKKFGKVDKNTDKDDAIKQVLQQAGKKLDSTTNTTQSNSNKKKIIVKNTEVEHKIEVAAFDIKTLTRLGSVSPESSFISVYYNPTERVLMLEGLVGTFGTYQLYFRNKKPGSK